MTFNIRALRALFALYPDDAELDVEGFPVAMEIESMQLSEDRKRLVLQLLPRKDGKTVRNAPPGVLLLWDGILVFKTEYLKENGDPVCYVVASGEYYCGKGFDVECVEVTPRMCSAMPGVEWTTE